VPRPIQPGVVGEDLQARADDEDHEKQIEEVLPSQPGGKTSRRGGARWLNRPGVLGDKALYRGVITQALGDSNRDNEPHEAEGEQPEQVEPLAPTNTHARGDAVDRRNRTRPGRGVDHVLASCQLRPITANDIRRDP